MARSLLGSRQSKNNNTISLLITYSKTCLKPSLKKRPHIGFQDRLLLNAGQKYCRMLQESILQYFRPSLSYHLSLTPLFCLFLSGHFRQDLLYTEMFRFILKMKLRCQWSGICSPWLIARWEIFSRFCLLLMFLSKLTFQKKLFLCVI